MISTEAIKFREHFDGWANAKCEKYGFINHKETLCKLALECFMSGKNSFEFIPELNGLAESSKLKVNKKFKEFSSLCVHSDTTSESLQRNPRDHILASHILLAILQSKEFQNSVKEEREKQRQVELSKHKLALMHAMSSFAMNVIESSVESSINSLDLNFPQQLALQQISTTLAITKHLLEAVSPTESDEPVIPPSINARSIDSRILRTMKLYDSVRKIINSVEKIKELAEAQEAEASTKVDEPFEYDVD